MNVDKSVFLCYNIENGMEVDFMEKNYNISEAAKKIGVSVKTLQRWDREGKLVANRTPSNRRYYTDSQLKEIKEGNFDIKDMVEIIKNKYENMKKREMTMENANVIGHVVYNFCTMQDADRINFFDSYNDIKLDGEHICTCDIMIDGKSIMSIITSPTKTSNDKSMKWLYNYMKKTGASRGIVIKGTVWSMVDADGVEYNIDFDKNVDEKVFEKFLI